jgi:hypothetical protein
MYFVPGLASNQDPPDLCLQSSHDYNLEPTHPTLSFLIMSAFSISVILTSHNESRSIAFSSIFQMSLCQIGIISYLNVE